MYFKAFNSQKILEKMWKKKIDKKIKINLK